jgi:universal stress protein E
LPVAGEQRVLVVVDPTASFHPAIERGAWLARSAPSIVELFICDYAPQLADARGAREVAVTEARAALVARHKARLEQLAGPLAAGGLKVGVDSRWDYPLHDGIVRKALDFRADVVVKDTHFHSVLKRSIFSNTDWSLIRNCPSPLLLVKPRTPGGKPCFVAAVDPLHERDKPADLDHKILRTAGALAKSLGGDLHVFHAFDITAALAVSTDSMTMPIALPVREFADAMRTEHTDAVNALCAAHGIAADHVHVHQGGTRELLMTLTEQLKADVVVMGAVSRSGLRGLFLGNTAEDVLDRLHCDLLIVKPDGFEAALPS